MWAVIWASLCADLNVRAKGTRGQSAHSRHRELAEEQTLAPGTSRAFDSTASLWACLYFFFFFLGLLQLKRNCLHLIFFLLLSSVPLVWFLVGLPPHLFFLFSVFPACLHLNRDCLCYCERPCAVPSSTDRWQYSLLQGQLYLCVSFFSALPPSVFFFPHTLSLLLLVHIVS